MTPSSNPAFGTMILSHLIFGSCYLTNGLIHFVWVEHTRRLSKVKVCWKFDQTDVVPVSWISKLFMDVKLISKDSDCKFVLEKLSNLEIYNNRSYMDLWCHSISIKFEKNNTENTEQSVIQTLYKEWYLKTVKLQRRINKNRWNRSYACFP